MTKPKKRNPWKVLGLGAAAAIIIFSVNTAENASKLFVNGKEVTTADAKQAGHYANGELFLPANATVKGMGDSASQSGSLGTTIQTKDGSYTFATNRSTAMKGDEFIPIATKKVNGVTVPDQVYPFVQGGTYMLPERAFKEILKYPVATSNEKDGLHVYVGKKPEVTPPKEDPKPSPTPSPGQVKEDPKYPFPAGWTPPTLNGQKATGNISKDAKVISDQLGFGRYSATSTEFYPDGNNNGLSVSKLSTDDFAAEIQINFWYAGNSPVEGANKVPYITKELLDFYNVPQVYDILEAGYVKGDISQANKMLTFNNRQVEVFAGPSYVTVTIGEPGKKYDKNWKLIK